MPLVIRPEDKKPAAIIGVAIALILIYFVAVALPRMQQSGPTAGPPTTGAAPTTAAAAPVRPAPSGPGPSASGTTVLPGAIAALGTQSVGQQTDTWDPNAPAPPATRDPFRSPVGTPAPPPAAPVTPLPGPTIGPEGRANRRSPSIPGSRPFSPPVPPPAIPALVLKGIMLGESHLAVIEMGDTTYYKHPGDTIAPGVTLGSVSEAGIIIHAGPREAFVGIGHRTIPEAGATSTLTALPPMPVMRPR